MKSSRRAALKILGGGVILAAGAAGVFVSTRTPTVALLPWQQAGTDYTDPRLAMLSWAILAPNPHNRQPWIVRLDDEDGFTLFAERDRKLPHTDPFDRQITIGLGCFLEVARLAAQSIGYATETTLFPQGEPFPILDDRPIAQVRLRRSEVSNDPLFQLVASRRTCKEPFDMSRLPSETHVAALSEMRTAAVEVRTHTHADKVRQMSELALRAHEIEIQTPRTYKESVDLMRIGKAEVEASPDGIDLQGAFIEVLNTVGVLTRETLVDTQSEAYAQGLTMYQQIFENTPSFISLTTPSNSRVDQINAGALWLRVNLMTTRLGLALHPVSQSLQEYDEMSESLDQVHKLVDVQGGARVQMLGRLGYGPSVAPSPRWPLETRLRHA